MDIGKKLKTARDKLNLTQKQLAKMIKGGIDYSYIGKIERNEQHPSLNILEKLAEALHIKLEYFFLDKPVELYLSSENKNNQKREEILNLLSHLNEEELNFIRGIIKFISQYKTYTIEQRTLKVAEKKAKYKASR